MRIPYERVSGQTGETSPEGVWLPDQGVPALPGALRRQASRVGAREDRPRHRPEHAEHQARTAPALAPSPIAAKPVPTKGGAERHADEEEAGVQRPSPSPRAWAGELGHLRLKRVVHHVEAEPHGEEGRRHGAPVGEDEQARHRERGEDAAPFATIPPPRVIPRKRSSVRTSAE